MTDDKILTHPDLVLSEEQVEELLRWAFGAYARADAPALDLAARAAADTQPVPTKLEYQLPHPYTVEIHCKSKPYRLAIQADVWFLSHPILCEWQSDNKPLRALVILEHDELYNRAVGEIVLCDNLSNLPQLTCPLFPESLPPDKFVELYQTVDSQMRPSPTELAAWLEQILPPHKRRDWKRVLETLCADD